MDKFDLQKRTMQFHVNVIKLCGRFPKNAAGFETAKQLIDQQDLLEQITGLHAVPNQMQTGFLK
jgi:hypothetical protein